MEVVDNFYDENVEDPEYWEEPTASHDLLGVVLCWVYKKRE